MRRKSKNLWIAMMFVSAGAALGCSAQHTTMGNMESAEKAANQRARTQLVAYMSLETMFPTRQARELARAAGRGDTTKVDALVRQGMDVNVHGKGNATPLFWVMKSDNPEGFRELLKLGADPNVALDDGGTMVGWAVQQHNPAYLQSLLAQGGDPNLRDGNGRTPIFSATGQQSAKVDILIEAGANMNARDSFGSTPMMLAAGRGDFDSVYTLLTHGADWRLESKYGGSLVYYIVKARKRMDPNCELYAWLRKVIGSLEARGVQIPAQ